MKLPSPLPKTAEEWRAFAGEHLERLAVSHDEIISRMVQLVRDRRTVHDSETLLRLAIEYQTQAAVTLQLAYAVAQATLNETTRQ